MRISNDDLHKFVRLFGFDIPFVSADTQHLVLDLLDARAEIERLKESLLCIAVLPNATSRSIADYSDIAIKALNPIYTTDELIKQLKEGEK